MVWNRYGYESHPDGRVYGWCPSAQGAGWNRINAAKVAVFRLAFTELFVHFCGPKEDKWH